MSRRETLDPRLEAALEAVLDRIVPRDEHPGARGAGAASHVLGRFVDRERLARALDRLDAESRERFGAGLARLGARERDELFARVEAGDLDGPPPHQRDGPPVAEAADALEPSALFADLCAFAAEAMYAVSAEPDDPSTATDENAPRRSAPLWPMIGYPPSPAGVRTRPWREASLGGGPAEPGHGPRSRPARPRSPARHDAIVVGAGVSGCLVAGELCAAGLSVLVLERGRDEQRRAVVRDHLRNHRLSLLGHGTGPPLAGHERVLVDASGAPRVVAPHERGYHNNASCVGGGGLVYGGMAWRFDPRDFRMRSEYGAPERSSLEDWPLDYAELAPFYARAEREVGVAGSGAPSPASPDERYPMPAHAGHPGRQALVGGAGALGWSTRGVPLLINAEPRAGRGACVRCSACVGFACPSDAKNGGHHHAGLRAALDGGRAALVTGALATRVDTDDAGRVTGVTYRRLVDGVVEEQRALSDRVVIACGAIESARLLLASPSAREPRGLGNAHDQVGRHLQGHVYVSATGLMPDDVEDGRGPGPSVATTEFSHDNDGLIGGGLLSDDFVLQPIVAFRDHLPPATRRWGVEAKRFMRDHYRRLLKVTGPIQEIPSPDCRVGLDPERVDCLGQSVARLSGAIHPESTRVAAFLRARAIEWLRASGAREVYAPPVGSPDFLSAGQHQAGTCRMGHDPERSVTDAFGRVHGHDNLHVIDASVHVTNGGFNPVLTVMALAYRNAGAMLAR